MKHIETDKCNTTCCKNKENETLCTYNDIKMDNKNSCSYENCSYDKQNESCICKDFCEEIIDNINKDL